MEIEGKLICFVLLYMTHLATFPATYKISLETLKLIQEKGQIKLSDLLDLGVDVLEGYVNTEHLVHLEEIEEEDSMLCTRHCGVRDRRVLSFTDAD